MCISASLFAFARAIVFNIYIFCFVFVNVSGQCHKAHPYLYNWLLGTGLASQTINCHFFAGQCENFEEEKARACQCRPALKFGQMTLAVQAILGGQLQSIN